VRYVDATYRRSGTLFEGRVKAISVESEHYLLTCCGLLSPIPRGPAWWLTGQNCPAVAVQEAE
jgi:hypothetical protein